MLFTQEEVQEIKQDPHMAYCRMLGVALPDDTQFEVVVLEDTEDVRHIVLPSVVLEDAELTEASGGGAEKAILSAIVQRTETGLFKNGAWGTAEVFYPGQQKHVSDSLQAVAKAAHATGSSSAILKGAFVGMGSTIVVGAGGVGVNAWLNS